MLAHKLWFLAFALTPVCSPAASQLSLDFVPATTEIHFTLHDVLHTVHGTFQLKHGTIRFDPDSGKASGEIIVDVTSGESGSGARDSRMHKEILESQRYPQATFTPDRLDGKLPSQGQSQIDVHGVFNIHGADHELTLHFQVEREVSQYVASAHFIIPYVQWGMKNPSNFVLKVDKTVEMDIKTTTAVVLSESL
jgi:polyisoprenoid-binding protein YceI